MPTSSSLPDGGGPIPDATSSTSPKAAGRLKPARLLGAFCLLVGSVAGLNQFGLLDDEKEKISVEGETSLAPVYVSADFPGRTLALPTQDRRAPIDTVGVVGNEMTVPYDVNRVGVYDEGGRLEGGGGAVLVVGHVRYTGQGDGVLVNLDKLKLGDALVTRGKGKAQGWRVTKIQEYQKLKGLPDEIFRSKGKRTLVVVTCGDLDAQGRYNSNVVVTAVPVETIIKPKKQKA